MDGKRDGLDPAAAYALSGLDRSALADLLVTPRWYHPAQGATLALLVASWATRSFPVVAAAALLWFVALVALPRLYRRTTGAWVVDGPKTAEPKRWASWLNRTAALGILLGLFLGSFDGPLRVGAVVVAVGVFVAVQALGRRFDDALREELRADPEIAFRIEERETP